MFSFIYNLISNLSFFSTADSSQASDESFDYPEPPRVRKSLLEEYMEREDAWDPKVAYEKCRARKTPLHDPFQTDQLNEEFQYDPYYVHPDDVIVLDESEYEFDDEVVLIYDETEDVNDENDFVNEEDDFVNEEDDFVNDEDDFVLVHSPSTENPVTAIEICSSVLSAFYRRMMFGAMLFTDYFSAEALANLKQLVPYSPPPPPAEPVMRGFGVDFSPIRFERPALMRTGMEGKEMVIRNSSNQVEESAKRQAERKKQATWASLGLQPKNRFFQDNGDCGIVAKSNYQAYFKS